MLAGTGPMDTGAFEHVRNTLPRTLAFPYYADRESPWLLAKRMPHQARVADLKTGSLGRFLDRPLVKPVVAASGGVLRRADVAAAAYADVMADTADTNAALAGVLAAFDEEWHDFELSFAGWAVGAMSYGSQMSRAGGNLVVQLGFPSTHAALMGKYLSNDTRKAFEYSCHPVRATGRPTLAWARVDVEGETALIEEVQSDWLRFAAARVRQMELYDPRSRHLKSLKTYEAGLRARYEKMWPKAMMTATLGILVDLLGVREIYMHTPEGGASLKRIHGRQPPVSLYTKLPKAFGLEPTDSAPAFLKRERRRDLTRLKQSGAPVFWRLTL